MADTLVNFTAKQPAAPSISTPQRKKLRIDSHHLFQDNSEIVIVHQNDEYHLRITRNGKLILTK
ncbi:MAG: hemin uptake protein HemP [Candidatus Binatia bacterium]